jgi:UDP-glucuronate 4-epimerase
LLQRDFTYIDDIVEGLIRVLDRAPADATEAPNRLYNIGNSSPVELMTFIRTLEEVLEQPAVLRMKEMQPGDVPATFADVSDLESDVGFRPSTGLRDGLKQFVSWYREYHRV